MKKLLSALSLLALLAGCYPVHAASRFAVCATTCTWDASSTVMWSASSGGATGASVPGSADTVTLDGSTCVGGTTCTITVNTNFNILGLTTGACTASTTGCILDLSANNNSPTVGANGVSTSGTGTRTLNLGSGTWTINSTTNPPWTQTTTTNFTFNANTSTIVVNPTGTTSRIFNLGTTGGTVGGWATITIGTNANLGQLSFGGGGATIATLNINAPNYVSFPSGVTTTLTNALAISGSSSNLVTVNSTSQSAVSTISSAAASTCTWCAIRDMTLSGGGSFTATSSFDQGQNTGFTITPPSGSGSGARIIGG